MFATKDNLSKKQYSGIIEAKNHQIVSPGGELLSEVNFKLNPGEVLFLKGANGTGKTTFMRQLHKMLQSKNSTGSSLSISESLDYSFMPQNINLEFFVPLTLGDVARLNPKCKGQQARKALMSDLNLYAMWDQASGGERQRALLSQVFDVESSFYMLDEPFNHLDSESINDVGSWICDQAQAHRRSFLITTHMVPKVFMEKGLKTKSILLERVG